jgi:hypothetical protein
MRDIINAILNVLRLLCGRSCRGGEAMQMPEKVAAMPRAPSSTLHLPRS